MQLVPSLQIRAGGSGDGGCGGSSKKFGTFTVLTAGGGGCVLQPANAIAAKIETLAFIGHLRAVNARGSARGLIG
jgi:hypothetical protein